MYFKIVSRVKVLSKVSAYQGPNTFAVPKNAAELLEVEEAYYKIFAPAIAGAMGNPDFSYGITTNTRMLQQEANFGSMVTPLR